MLVKEIYSYQVSRAKILSGFFSQRQNPLSGSWEMQMQGLDVKIRISKKDEMCEIEDPENIIIKAELDSSNDSALLSFFVHLNDKIMNFEIELNAFDAENISNGGTVELSAEETWNSDATMIITFKKA